MAENEQVVSYVNELREIAGMLAHEPNGPVRWKQYRLVAIADYLSSRALEASQAAEIGLLDEAFKAWYDANFYEMFAARPNERGDFAKAAFSAGYSAALAKAGKPLQAAESGFLDEAVEALKPFASRAERYDDTDVSKIDDNVELWQLEANKGLRVDLTVGDLRKAHALLAKAGRSQS